MAYTQIEYLPILQLASITGIAGISFIMYMFHSTLFSYVNKQIKQKTFLVYGGILLAIISWGSLRLKMYDQKNKSTVKAAAVGTDSKVGAGPIPDKRSRQKVQRNLFLNTKKAADSGAKIVVWNEAATAVFPAEEKKWKKSLQLLAKKNSIHLIAGYILPLTFKPLKYENKYLWFKPDGNIDHSYLKHEPVAGEPAVKGTEEFTYVSSKYGKLSGAICYDYDFPWISREHGSLDIDIVALPSSDWRGIDPIHTQMARIRAIEGGHSIIRSTRFGLSAGIDPYGRIRSWMSAYDENTQILLMDIPNKGVRTIYSRLGNGFVYLCMILVLVIVIRSKKITNK